MHTTLENRKKATSNFPRNDFERKNKVEKIGALCSRMKRE
jgi:hypothetical protein